MKSKVQLCCILDPYVVCIVCLAPVCETCADDVDRKHHLVGCQGVRYIAYEDN